MNCPSCGTDNTPDRKYCGLCGHYLGGPPVASSSVASPSINSPSIDSPSISNPSIAQSGPTRPLPAKTPAPSIQQHNPPLQQTSPITGPPPQSVASGAATQTARLERKESAVPVEQTFFADAFRYALSWRPLSLLAVGFFVSIMILFFSTLVNSVIVSAMLRGGGSLDAVGAIGLVLTALTLLVCYIVEITFLSATTKICYERVVNGRALRRAEAMKFAVSNAGSVIIAPFLFVLVTIVVFFVEYLVFLLGSTETIGPVVTGLFFAPFVVINAFLFFVINYAIWMALITVSSGVRSIGETVSKTINLVKQSFRTRVPEILSLTLVQLLIGFFAIVVIASGFVLTSMVAAWGGANVPIDANFAGRIARAIDRLIVGSPGASGFRTGSEPSIFGPLLGLLTLAGGLALIVGMLLAFPRVFFANGCIRIYQRLVDETPAQIQS